MLLRNPLEDCSLQRLPSPHSFAEACKGLCNSSLQGLPTFTEACITAACKGFLHFHKEAHTLFFSHPSVQHGPSREVVPIGILTTFQNELLQVSQGFHHARVLADPPEVAVEGVDLSPPRFLHLVEAALQATVQADFSDLMRPKHHWPLHLPDCLQRWQQLPSCWALERKHKVPRKYGSNQFGLEAYNKAVMTGVTQEHVGKLLKDEELFVHSSHIISKTALGKPLESLLRANDWLLPGMEASGTCRLENGMLCKSGDILFYRKAEASSSTAGFPWACGSLKHCISAAGFELAVMLSFLFVKEKPGTHASVWQSNPDKFQLVRLQDLLQPAIYSHGNDGCVTCLLPAPLSAAW